MKLRLEIFEGPLDLLLYIVKKNHINVCDIPIVEVLKQYLQYLELMNKLDINVASEYMVMVAELINIKSKMLLPQHKEEVQQEEESVQCVVDRLLEYEKFKEAANYLQEKENMRAKYITRPPSYKKEGEVYFEVSLFDLINAFRSALKEVSHETFFEVVKEEFTVEDKIHDILHRLVVEEEISLKRLFQQAKSKLEIIVIFLAILELIRLKEAIIIQKELFGEIHIVRNKRVYVHYE